MSFSSLFSFHAFSGNKPNLVTNATLAPINVTLLSNTANSITVSFTPPGGTVTGYTPYVNGVAGTGSGTPASYTITGLSGGTSYNIVIYASMSIGGITTFLPTSIPGCSLWLDATDNTSMVLSGSNLTQWNDKSGNGYNFTSTSGHYPVYSTNNISITGSGGSTQYLTNSSIPFTTTYSIFIVGNENASPPSLYGYNYILKGSLTSDGLLFFGANGTNFATFVGLTNAWNDTTVNSPSTSVLNKCIMEVTNSGTSSGLLSYINGSALTAKNGTATSFTGLAIGDTMWATGQCWNGNINEILIFNSVLTTNQRQQIEGYLAWKWGIQSSLQVAHPNYSVSGVTTLTTKTYTSDGSVVKSLSTTAAFSFYLNNTTYLTSYFNFNQSTTLNSNYNVVNNTLIADYASTTNFTTSNYNSAQTPVLAISNTQSLTSPYSLYFAGGESFWGYFTLPVGCPGFSVSVWFYPTTSAANAASPTGYPRIWESSLGDSYSVFHPTNQLNLTGDTINASMILNTWNHLVGVYNIATNTRRYYFNGALTATNSGSGYAANNTYNISFGNKQNDSVDPFIGYMDEMRFYSNVLNANDVKQLYAYTGAAPSATYFPLSPAWTPSYSSLVAYFMLDEAVSSTSAVEQIGAYNGTVVSGAAFGTTGKVGTCATFNGSNSYISVPYQVLNNLTSGTIMAWVYPTSVTGGAIFAKQHDGVNTFGIFSIGGTSTSGGVFTAGTSGYVYWHGQNSQTPGSCVSNSAISVNTWSHLAVTFTTTSVSIYINGQISSTTSTNGSVPNDTAPTYTCIGAWPNATNGISIPFAGQIDDLSVWNTALTADNIATIYSYQSTGVGAPTGLTFISSTTTSVTFSFTAPAGTGITYTPYVNGSAGTGSGTPSSYTITGLTTATAYSITLTATVSGLTSTKSVAISVITPISGEVFALSFGSSSTVPTTDKYGATLSTATGTLSMYNDPTRGYVLNLSNAGMATTYAASALSFTRACWYYNGTASMGTYANLLSTDNSPFFYTNSTQISLAINFTAGAPYKYATDPVGRGSGSWVHYAATYDGTTAYFYTNGSQVASLAYSFSTADTSALRIGYYAVQNVNPSAYMDNIHVYNRVLAASEILALYTAENSNPKI